MNLWSIISWRRRQRERAATQRRLDVSWEEFADGRIRRLKRGRDYEAETGEVMNAANAAAARQGMVARVAPEQVPKMRFFESYVWVQFADHEIEPEQPCPCGEPNPIRVHPVFARCPSCGSRLAVKRPKGSKRGGGQSGRDRSVLADDESGSGQRESANGSGSRARIRAIVTRLFRRQPRVRSADGVTAKGSSDARATGSSDARAKGSSDARATGSSDARAKGSSRARAKDSSGARAKGSSGARAKGSSGARAKGGDAPDRLDKRRVQLGPGEGSERQAEGGADGVESGASERRAMKRARTARQTRTRKKGKR